MRAMMLRLSSVLVCLACLASACTTTNNTCDPACREGYTCVNRACVSACNPPCGIGEVCVGGFNNARCVTADGGSAGDGGRSDGAPSDVVSTVDGVSQIDVISTGDGAGGLDVIPSGDGAGMDGVGPGDVAPSEGGEAGGTDVVGDAAPPCGHGGEACCGRTFCLPGADCFSGTCRAFTRVAGECSRPADCPAGQACIGPQTCDTHGCFRCGTPGAGAIGAACTVGTDCAGGVCRNSACTVPCPLGATGDTECSRSAAGYICTQLNYTVSPMGTSSTVALGVCRRGCLRNGDCTAPEACLPTLNYVTDRMDFVCGRSSGTLLPGANCMNGSECQSLLCVPGSGTMGMGACTAPCTVASDCPPAAAMCLDINWLRPTSGGLQPGRGCLPR